MLVHLQPDQNWKTALDKADNKASPYIAGFLEPEIIGLNLDDAVQSWKANIEPYADRFTLIPPITGQNDLKWLPEVMDACTDCTMKGPIAFNVYVSSDAAGVTDFNNHLQSMISAFAI